MSTKSLMSISIPYLPISLSSLPSANYLTPKPRKCWKSWSCNMLCNTMRPATGSSLRTSPSSPTSPFSPSANCTSHSASSTKKPRRRDELISLPSLQWPPEHLWSTQCPLYISLVQQMWLLLPPGKCPVKEQSCYACGGHNHYPYPIPCPWWGIASDYITHRGKEYLLICDLFSKNPFL